MLKQVTQEKLKEWKSQLEYGDKGKMGLSSPIIWKAFKQGQATDKTIEKIDAYFASKKTMATA